MFSKIVSTLVLVSLLTSNVAVAQEQSNQNALSSAKPALEAGEQDPGKVLSPMKKGQKAPYTGVLLAPQTIASVIADYEAVPEKVKLEVKKAVAEAQNKCDRSLADAKASCEADKAALQSQIDDDKKVIKAYDEQLKVLRDKQTNPLLWTGVGVVGGVAVTLLTVFAVSAAKN
jgi:hypothetical protein